MSNISSPKTDAKALSTLASNHDHRVRQLVERESRLNSYYQFSKVLSQDNISEVWIARFKGNTHKNVLVEFFWPSKTSHITHIQQSILDNQLKALRYIDEYTCIASVIDHDELRGGTHFLVTEYPKAVSLARLQASQTYQFGVVEVMEIVRDIALDLQKLHNLGLVHNNLSLDSICVKNLSNDSDTTDDTSTSSRVKVLGVRTRDLGLDLTEDRLPNQKSSVNSQAFIPSETPSSGITELLNASAKPKTKVRPSEDNPISVRPTDDIHSLGLVAYECLMGENTVEGTLTRFFVRKLPESVTSLILSMTASEAEDRPTANEVINITNSIIASEGTETSAFKSVFEELSAEVAEAFAANSFQEAPTKTLGLYTDEDSATDLPIPLHAAEPTEETAPTEFMTSSLPTVEYSSSEPLDPLEELATHLGFDTTEHTATVSGSEATQHGFDVAEYMTTISGHDTPQQGFDVAEYMTTASGHDTTRQTFAPATTNSEFPPHDLDLDQAEYMTTVSGQETPPKRFDSFDPPEYMLSASDYETHHHASAPIYKAMPMSDLADPDLDVHAIDSVSRPPSAKRPPPHRDPSSAAQPVRAPSQTAQQLGEVQYIRDVSTPPSQRLEVPQHQKSAEPLAPLPIQGVKPTYNTKQIRTFVSVLLLLLLLFLSIMGGRQLKRLVQAHNAPPSALFVPSQQHLLLFPNLTYSQRHVINSAVYQQQYSSARLLLEAWTESAINPEPYIAQIGLSDTCETRVRADVKWAQICYEKSQMMPVSYQDMASSWHHSCWDKLRTWPKVQSNLRRCYGQIKIQPKIKPLRLELDPPFAAYPSTSLAEQLTAGLPIWLPKGTYTLRTFIPNSACPPKVKSFSPQLGTVLEVPIEAPCQEPMVLVPKGPFIVGCNPNLDSECQTDERPQRSMFLSDFYIDRTEVTVAEYRTCVQAGGCVSEGLSTGFLHGHPMSLKASSYCNWNKKGRDQHPINCVAWTHAKQYCDWAQKRLPTEYEWEKAARGTDGRKYPWGHTPRVSCKYAVVPGCGFSSDQPVGQMPQPAASPYGAQDMLGNVWEWTSSPYNANARSVRGSSWRRQIEHARASNRLGFPPEYRLRDLGFRCVRDLDGDPVNYSDSQLN